MGSSQSANQKTQDKGKIPENSKTHFEVLKEVLERCKTNPREVVLHSKATQSPKTEQNNANEQNSNGNDMTELSNSYDELLRKGKSYDRYNTQRCDLLNKLSEVAGARLKNNNPAITDLSDQNRPNKLAEQFSELYDNEWTDTAEELRDFADKTLSEVKKEEVIIEFLLSIMKETYAWCADRSRQQMKDFLAMLTFQPSDTSTSISLDDFNTVVQKKCKDLLKKHSLKVSQSPEFKKNLKKEVIKIVGKNSHFTCFQKAMDSTDNFRYFDVFFDKCIKLSWLMVNQDPSVVLEYGIQNRDRYRAYTRSGDHVDYIVWPSLLLFKDGPLLYKGVAQLKFVQKNIPKVKDEGNVKGEETDSNMIEKSTTQKCKKETSLDNNQSLEF